MVQVGELIRYYRKGKKGDVALHPVLYTWQEMGQVCISEADADLLAIANSVAEYDVGDILFEYPVCVYGYPEIYNPPSMPMHVRSYMRRLFNPLADVWIRYEGKDPL